MNVSGAGLGGNSMDSVAAFVSQFSSFSEFQDYILSHPNENPMLYNMVISNPGQMEAIFNSHKAIANASSTGDYNAALGEISSQGVELSAEKEKYIDNLISGQRTDEARQFEEYMRNTQYLSAGEQAEKLGVSPASITFGAATSNPVATAGTSKHSAAALHQQERINDFNQRMSLARSLIHTAGSMASSGIYGAALGAIKHSAAALSASAANSGMQALAALRPEVRNQLMKDEAWRYNNSHNEGLNF